MQPAAWVEYRKLVSYGRSDIGVWDFSAWRVAGTRDAWWVSVSVTTRPVEGHSDEMHLSEERQTDYGGTIADVRRVAALLVESLTERVRRIRGGQ